MFAFWMTLWYPNQVDNHMPLCSKKTLAAFGTLLALACLIVPYRETHASIERTSDALARRISTQEQGFMFLPSFIKNSGRWISVDRRHERWVRLDRAHYATQIGVVGVIGVFDYLLLCVWLPGRKRRSNDEFPT